jgi:hypothetical protein
MCFSFRGSTAESAGLPFKDGGFRHQLAQSLVTANRPIQCLYKSLPSRGSAALLKNALQRCLQASEAIGARAVLVHAIDAEAKAFYQHFGFEECFVDDLHLMLLVKDIPVPA